MTETPDVQPDVQPEDDTPDDGVTIHVPSEYVDPAAPIDDDDSEADDDTDLSDGPT